MLTTANIRNQYSKIQEKLFYMIPERWDKVFLYASVIEHYNKLETGEMFFYYYPKSVLKKNPVNVYEVPAKFNIDEKKYLNLAENLYNEIKKLRKIQIDSGEKPWSNVTISIKDFKFNIEYNYENLLSSKYTSYDRHIIWRYKNLDNPIDSYSKKDRKMIEKYLEKEQSTNKNMNTYNEGIYKKPVKNLVEYDKEEIVEKDIQMKTENNTNNNVKSQILNLNN